MSRNNSEIKINNIIIKKDSKRYCPQIRWTVFYFSLFVILLSIAAPATAGVRETVYLTNYRQDTVSAIDMPTNTVVATIEVGDYPLGMAFKPDENWLYVANENDDSVSVVNTRTKEIEETITVGDGPVELLLGQGLSRLYVANRLSNNISVINTTNNQVIKTINVESGPARMAYSSVSDRLYTANLVSHSISLIDANNDVVLDKFSLEEGLADVAVNQQGTLLFLANALERKLTIMAGDLKKKIAEIDLGFSPRRLLLAPDEDALYVLGGEMGQTAEVHVIDLSIDTLEAHPKYEVDSKIKLGPVNYDGWAMTLSPGGNRLYVAGCNINTLFVVDVKRGRLFDSVQVNEISLGVLASPNW